MTAILTVDAMKAKVTEINAALEEIQETLSAKLTDGSAQAQAKRLVAFALAKQATGIFEQVAGSVEYLSAPAKSEPSDGLLGSLVQVAEEMAEAIMAQFGVQQEAIAPFALETNSIMLPVVEDLVSRSKAALAEADALDAAA